MNTITPRHRVEIIGNATLYLGDCRDVLSLIPSAAAIVTDPPYGVAVNRNHGRRGRNTDQIIGDEFPPDIGWMASVPSVIWGGNMFCGQLPISSGWLVWNKYHPDESQHSQAELAWSNVTKTVRHYSEAYHGFMRAADGWHHPTQKPPRLMQWCLEFLPPDLSITDPYMGSGTTGIACARLGRSFVGVEIHEPYFDIACRRIEQAQRQGDMFASQPIGKSDLDAAYQRSIFDGPGN